jgi:hypothetical protein
MSMRAISELTCYYALGIGHSLMNLTARTLALDNQLHVNLEKKFGTTFPPFSDEFRAWPALSKPKAEHLRQIAKTSRHGPFATLVDPIHTLASSEAWERLNEVRGEDFHRWRPQAVGMFTARKENPWTRSADGTFWTLEGSFGDRLGIDSADKTAKDTYLPARSVLDLQCSIMRDFDTQFEAACKAVFPAIRSLSL